MEEYQEIELENMDVLECLIKSYGDSFKDLKQGVTKKLHFQKFILVSLWITDKAQWEECVAGIRETLEEAVAFNKGQN